MNKMAEEQLLTSYLLGDLPEEEQARIEERIFADDDFYEQIEAATAELADDYARGELTPRERVRYEQRFLFSESGRERAAFARTMARAFDKAPAAAANETSSWRQSIRAFFRGRPISLQFSMAAVMLALALGIGWVIRQNLALRSQLDHSRAEQARLQRQADLATERQRARGEELRAALERERVEREKLQKELDQARVPQSPPAIPAFVSFLLTPGLTRGSDEPEKLVVPAAARQIRLRLDTGGDDDYRSFHAEIRARRGALVWSQAGISARAAASGTIIPLIVPTGALPPGEYELTLQGVVRRGEARVIGYYYFNILRN
ncbi:MAG: hypothetical protein ACKVX9_03310 [Blastocatellia bacterium]